VGVVGVVGVGGCFFFWFFFFLWIEWHPQRASAGEHEADVRAIPDFVEHFCAKKAIPPEFYRGFAAIEFKQGGPEGPPLRS